MRLRLGWLLILVALGLNACRGSWGAAAVATQSQGAGAKSDDIFGTPRAENESNGGWRPGRMCGKIPPPLTVEVSSSLQCCGLKLRRRFPFWRSESVWSSLSLYLIRTCR